MALSSNEPELKITQTEPSHIFKANPKPKQSRVWQRGLRYVVPIMIVVVLVGAITFAWRPKPIQVELAAVRDGEMKVTIDEVAKTRVRDRYVIMAPLPAKLMRIELHVGDPIQAGSVIARLVPMDAPLLDARSRAESETRVALATATQKQAEASVKRAELARIRAHEEAERTRRLQESGSVSLDARERADFEAQLRVQEFESARFAVQTARHEVEMARIALQRFEKPRDQEVIKITAPANGRVLRIIQENAGIVQAGAPLLEIGDPTALEIVSEVLTTDAVHIREGALVTIDRWGGAPLRAHVRLVEPSAFTRISALGVDEQRVRVILDLDEPSEKWSSLADGYRVEANILIWRNERVRIVPTSAVFRYKDTWAVYVTREGRAKLASITIGQRNGREVQILEGLQANELVIMHPSERIVDGARVTSQR